MKDQGNQTLIWGLILWVLGAIAGFLVGANIDTPTKPLKSQPYAKPSDNFTL